MYTQGSITGTTTILESSWSRVWYNLKLVQPEGIYEQLLEVYNEPHRYYHTLQHLSDCLLHFESVKQLAKHPGEVEFALWFHDAIYDSKSPENEVRSARWAVEVLSATKVSSVTIERVYELIMSTKHDLLPYQPDNKLLVDIDLAILGADIDRFNEYNYQVEQEYSWVPRVKYREKRVEVLESFLFRPTVYSTDYFIKRFEAKARANICSIIGIK